MWVVAYTRWLDHEVVDSRFKTDSRVAAWVVYQLWAFRYALSNVSIKKLSLLCFDRGVISLARSKSRSTKKTRRKGNGSSRPIQLKR
jgi:hypothetical protein